MDFEYPLRVSVLIILSPGVDTEKWHTPEKVRPSGKLYVTKSMSAKGTVRLWTIFLFLFYFLGMG